MNVLHLVALKLLTGASPVAAVAGDDFDAAQAISGGVCFEIITSSLDTEPQFDE